jgi:hypothetical protein
MLKQFPAPAVRLGTVTCNVARRLGAAPSPPGFGDPAAQAGARRKLLSPFAFCLVPSAFFKVVRLPGVAPGHPPWRGDILLLNHSRWKLKGPGALLFAALPALDFSTKNKHLLVIYSIPTRGFTAVVSVFRGTPPAKPFDCKIRLDPSGALRCDPRAEPAGGEPRLSSAVSCLVPGDIL